VANETSDNTPAIARSQIDADRVNEIRLGSGHTLAIRQSPKAALDAQGGTGESIELRSKDGALELRITMTREGPMLHVKGGALSIEAADAVSVSCKRFDVRATESIHMETGLLAVESAGEVRLKSMGQTHIDGELLHLNCGDRTGYPEPPAYIMPEEMAREVFGDNAELARKLGQGHAYVNYVKGALPSASAHGQSGGPASGPSCGHDHG